MSEQDKRAVSICEAMENIPRSTSPRTPLIWAYELKAQRDEMLATLRQALRHAREAMPAHERKQFDDGIAGPEWMFNVRDTIKKVEATL